MAQPQRGCVIPNVTFIPLYLMLHQERSHFVLEAQFSVMALLVGYVCLDLLQIRLADRKICITALPFEMGKATLLFQPKVGYTLQFLYPFRLCDASTKPSK